MKKTTIFYFSLDKKPQLHFFLWMKTPTTFTLKRAQKYTHQGGQWKQLVHSPPSVRFSNLTIIGVNGFLQTSFTKSLGQLLLVV
jgi:hypothetical protein